VSFYLFGLQHLEVADFFQVLFVIGVNAHLDVETVLLPVAIADPDLPSRHPLSDVKWLVMVDDKPERGELTA
jgi:hypothetical protein